MSQLDDVLTRFRAAALKQNEAEKVADKAFEEYEAAKNAVVECRRSFDEAYRAMCKVARSLALADLELYAPKREHQ